MYLRTFDIFATFNINYAAAFLFVEVGTARNGTKWTFFQLCLEARSNYSRQFKTILGSESFTGWLIWGTSASTTERFKVFASPLPESRST